MGSDYFSRRSIAGEPTHITLPNAPIKYGRRRELGTLVPTYVELMAESQEVHPKLLFIHMAIAVQKNRDDWLERVLSQFAHEVPCRDEVTGTNLLHIAAKSCKESTLNILLKYDIINHLLNEADMRGTTPLITAAWYGNFAALKYFLALGADTTSYVYDSKINALHCAADLSDTQICSQLLKYNNKRSFIDAVDSEGYTPLMIAVRGGSPCVTILLMAGANYKHQSTITGRNIFHTAILFFQNETLVKLVRAINEPKLISAVDFNGDNSFLLAIRLKNYEAVKILINNFTVNKLLTNSKNCIHYLIKNDSTDLLGVLLAVARHGDFLEWTDRKGRTPLMYAVETQRTDYISEILMRDKKLWSRNPLNGETVLHLAAYTNNANILKELLNVKEIDNVIDICDYGGRTAMEIVLSIANPDCYYAFKDSGYISETYMNSHKESSLFIAAKFGNYDLMLNLLLSDKFLTFHKQSQEFNKLELVRAELQGLIHSSDSFIISGETLNLHAWNRSPNQAHLFQHNVENKNIFHACVMGGNIMCLAFIYSYCVLFNEHWQDLDSPDSDGSTPLLLATKTGQGKMFKFFVQHGANLIKKNLKGEFALKEMTVYVPHYQNLFLNMLTECVIEDPTKRKVGMSSRSIKVSYHIFCPPGTLQLMVITTIFDVLTKEEDIEILQSPMIEYFIELKWERLRGDLKIRFFVNLLTVLLTYSYVTVRLWSYSFPKYLPFLLREPTLILSIISICINITQTCTRTNSLLRRILSTCVIISPISTIIYLYMDTDNTITSEIGSAAVLTAGASVFIHAIDTPLGRQISIFYKVFRGILEHTPLSSILLFSFAICFFVLYHDIFNFSSPFQSFLYTIMVLFEGDSSQFPLFEEPPETNASSPDSKDELNVRENLGSVIFQSVMMIIFKILVSITLLNMLIGLSVRGAGELEKGGQVLRLKTKVGVIYEWEEISYSRIYKWISRHHLNYLLGLHPNLTEKLRIPVTISPTVNPSVSFDIIRLKNMAIKQEDVTTVDIKFLAENIGYRNYF